MHCIEWVNAVKSAIPNRYCTHKLISSLAHVMRWFDRLESNVLALGNTKVQRSTPSRVSDTSQCCNQPPGG
jgi:hypothetical protein